MTGHTGFPRLRQLPERGGVGSLLLVARRGHEWVHVGEVGTDFKEKGAAYLKKTLDTLKTRTMLWCSKYPKTISPRVSSAQPAH